jgi:hypothetical protein
LPSHSPEIGRLRWNSSPGQQDLGFTVNLFE